MKQLIAYLLDHAIIDFSGDLTLDMVRDFLRDDDSPEGRKLLGKLVEDRGVDDMVVTLGRLSAGLPAHRDQRRRRPRADPALQRELSGPADGRRPDRPARCRRAARSRRAAAGCSDAVRHDPVPRGPAAPLQPGHLDSRAGTASGRRPISEFAIVFDDYPDPDTFGSDTLLLTTGFYWVPGAYRVDLMRADRRHDDRGAGSPATSATPSTWRRPAVAGGVRDRPTPPAVPDRRSRRRARPDPHAPFGRGAGDVRDPLQRRGLPPVGPGTAAVACTAPAGGLSLCAEEAWDALVDVPSRQEVGCGWCGPATPPAATCSASCCLRLPDGAPPSHRGRPPEPARRSPLGPRPAPRPVAAWIDAGANALRARS